MRKILPITGIAVGLALTTSAATADIDPMQIPGSSHAEGGPSQQAVRPHSRRGENTHKWEPTATKPSRQRLIFAHHMRQAPVQQGLMTRLQADPVGVLRRDVDQAVHWMKDKVRPYTAKIHTGSERGLRHLFDQGKSAGAQLVERIRGSAKGGVPSKEGEGK